MWADDGGKSRDLSNAPRHLHHLDGHPVGHRDRVPEPDARVRLAVGETSVILLHPPLPSVGVSIVMERERQQNDSLADG